ncbi:MAG TPA: polymer-forming cytoskeletal protein [Terriglobales bacterium]|nr:polymer-forming cytoskeletal protein [Terriglobales bacterium]
MANSGESSHLGKSFHFKGDISGSEDIYIDGKVEGTIQLPGQIVTVGQHGDVNADIDARELVIHGKLKGNAKASDRIELARTGSVQGDLAMARISIQDGAFMQGRVDIRSGQTAAPAAPPPRPPLASATSASPGPQQASFLSKS